MDHPEIYGKHKFNDARTRTKDAIDRQRTQLHLQLHSCAIDQNSCDITLKLSYLNIWSYVTKHWIRASFRSVTYMIRRH